MLARLLAPATALALLVGAAGCGDDTDIDPEADEDLIEDALIDLRDLPDGWVERDGAEDDSDDVTNVCNEDVLDLDPDELDDDKTAEAGPASYEGPDESMLLDVEIDAFRDRDLPARVVEAIAEEDEDYLDCLEDEIREVAGEGGLEVERLRTIRSPIDADDADGAAIEVEATIEGANGPVTLGIQQHAVLVDRYGITLQVLYAEQFADEAEDLVEDLLEEMVDRLEGR